MKTGRIVDNDDVIFAQVMMRKGADSGPTLVGLHAKVDQLNNGILPPGVKLVPMIDRSDLLRYTLDTVMHNLTEGMILVTGVLFIFLFNARAALIVALTIPFSLLFASIFLDLTKVPVNLLSLGALDFGMVVDGTVVMVENIVRHMSRRHSHSGTLANTGRSHPRRRPRSPAARVLFDRHHHHGLHADLHAPTSGGPVCSGPWPGPWHSVFSGALTFSILVAPVLCSAFFRRGVREPRNRVMELLTNLYRNRLRWAIRHRWITVGVGLMAFATLSLSGLERSHRFGVPAPFG